MKPPGYGRTGPRARAAVRVLVLATLVCTGGGVGAQPAPGAPPPPAAPAAAPKAAQIDRNGVLILIRSTLLAVHDANVTGNYTVLRDLGAPGFQTGNTAARLSEIFANLRAQNVDLSGVAVLDPQLTLLPQIETNGMMRMAGFFPSVPVQVNFELMFAPVGGKWRLFGISVGLGSSSPTAPEAKAVEQSPPAPTTTQATKPATNGAPKPVAKRSPRPATPKQPPAPAHEE